MPGKRHHPYRLKKVWKALTVLGTTYFSLRKHNEDDLHDAGRAVAQSQEKGRFKMSVDVCCSRRGFVAGMAAGAGAIATSLGSSAVSEAKADEPKAGEPATYNCDVVVIGAGFAGLIAAISAAEEGARVILMEQGDDVKTMYAHSIAAVGTSFQKEAGIELTPQDLVDDWNREGIWLDESLCDKEAQLFAASHSAEMIDWLMDHGVDIVGVTVPPTGPFTLPARIFVTSSGTDGREAFLLPLLAKAQEDGVEVLFSTEATGIVKDGDTVSAVEATGPEGEPVLVSAKAVVVCAGGFGGSPEMVARYAPMIPNNGTYAGLSQGFAIKQAKELGAELVLPGGCVCFYTNEDGAHFDMYGQALYVDVSGKRWVNENCGRRDREGIAVRKGIGEFWALYDGPLFDEVAASTAQDGLENGSVVMADSF